jgi:hypothetical protein
VATTSPTLAQTIRIDRGGFGVTIRLDQPRKVVLGANATVMIQLVEPGDKSTPAAAVSLKYRLEPFGAGSAPRVAALWTNGRVRAAEPGGYCGGSHVNRRP